MKTPNFFSLHINAIQRKTLVIFSILTACLLIAYFPTITFITGIAAFCKLPAIMRYCQLFTKHHSQANQARPFRPLLVPSLATSNHAIKKPSAPKLVAKPAVKLAMLSLFAKSKVLPKEIKQVPACKRGLRK